MADRSSKYVGCLCVHRAALHAAAVTVLERYHVGFVRRMADNDVWYELRAITAQQYDAVLEALSDTGEPGLDWDFPLE